MPFGFFKNESYLKNQHPGFNHLISDSSYNRFSFNYKKIIDGWIVDVLISKKFIEIDKVMGEAVIGTGYIRNELTYGGTSKINNLFYSQTDHYKNSISVKNDINKQRLQLIEGERFSFTPENVSVQNNAKLTVNSEMGVRIEKDFSMTAGTQHEIHSI